MRAATIRRVPVWVWGLVLLLVAGFPLAAQSASGAFLTGQVGLGLRTDDLISGSAVGAAFGFRFPAGLVLAMDYLYAGTDFYYWDGGSWIQAAGWADVPDNGVGRADWNFYRRRHAVGLAGGISGQAGPLGLFATAGLLLGIIELSDAAEFYPEFRDAARVSSIGSSTVVVDPVLRAGLQFPARGAVSGTLAWMVTFDREPAADTGRYVQRNSLLLLGISLQQGGM